MRKRIFRGMCVVALVTAFLISGFVTYFMYKQFYNNMVYDVKTSTKYIALAINKSGTEYLSQINEFDNVNRITLIDSNGKVLYDNNENPENMQNHSDREEFIEASEKGYGESIRYSETLRETTFYNAIKLDDGKILRVANTTKSIYSMIMSYVPYIIFVILILYIIIVLLAKRLTNKIIDPLNKINLMSPLDNDIYDEMAPLLARLNKQSIQIESQIAELKQKKEEFETITANMSEGLILLDSNENIISINSSASKIFKIDGNVVGQTLINITRNEDVLKTVESSIYGENGEIVFSIENNYYNLFSNSVMDGVRVKGVVIIIVDITQSYESEKMRREFSANVSHELKTPLTSISGYAELMKNNMVREKDIQMFATRIYNEAQNLIVMVENIISISRLDEGSIGKSFETVDVCSAAKAVVDRLRTAAKKKDVSIIFDGEKSEIKGLPQLIDEMLYNLCENGIKYNTSGGTVKVSVKNINDDCVISIKDSGIGIPSNEHERIFERFYRVDKSHTKSTGGTGLGLSIVKHCVKIHRGTIDLISEEGKGSEFIIKIKRK